MAAGDKLRLIKPISQRQFELHAPSLERGPNFDPGRIFSAYQVGQGSACGCILLDPERGAFTTLAMRRRIDHLWVARRRRPFSTPETALGHLGVSMRGGEPPEPLPSGAVLYHHNLVGFAGVRSERPSETPSRRYRTPVATPLARDRSGRFPRLLIQECGGLNPKR